MNKFSEEQERLFHSIKSEKLATFLTTWDIHDVSEDEQQVFFFYELLNRRNSSDELILQLIEQLTGKEKDWQLFFVVIFLHNKAYYLWRNQNKIVEAQSILMRALEIIVGKENSSIVKYKGRIFDTLGLIKKGESQLKEASYMFELAVENKLAGNDLEGLAITYGNLGRLNMELGNYLDAIKYLELDINLMREHFSANELVLAQLISTLAWANLEKGEYDIAQHGYLMSQEINSKLNNHTGLFYNFIGLAEVEMHKNRVSEAQRLINESELYLHSPEFYSPAYESSKSQYSLVSSALHLKNGDIDAAKYELNQIIEKQSFLNQIQLAKTYHALAQLSSDNEKIDNLIEALRILDKTDHVRFRDQVERELEIASKAHYLLHAAGRFAGQEQIEFLINQAGSDGFRGTETEMAVLFSDIRGFTSLSEKMSPQDLITTLNRFFTLMTRVISDYGGYVDKFIGDAIMAVFAINPQITPEDNCENSIKAALHMRSELQRFKLTLGKGFDNLDVGIGIHYGKMVSGLIGSPQKRSFTVIGDTVNTASRLEGLTKQLGATILISEEIRNRLRKPEEFVIRPLGSYRPKGKKNPISLFDIPAYSRKDFWTQELENEAESLKIYHLLNSENKRTEALERISQLNENQFLNYKPGYQLLNFELQKYPLEQDYQNWDKVINLTSK